MTGFPIITLGSVARVFNGKTPSKADQRETGHPVLKIKDVDESGLFRGPFESFVDEAFAGRHAERCAAMGDTLILNAAHNADYVGSKTFFVSSECIGALTTGEWLIIRPLSPRVNPRYISHWINTNIARSAVRELVKGIHLYPKDVERLNLPFPPLPEQRRIASILDYVDDLRRKRQKSTGTLSMLADAVFRDLFGDPNRNTKRWPIVEVGSVTDCIVPGRDKPKSFSGNIPWITTAEVAHLGVTGLRASKAGLTEAEIKEVRARIVPARSVIMTCVGDLGVVSIADVPMVINQQLHAFQCSTALIPEYLMYALSYQVSYMRRMATQTTLPYMNKSVCNGIPVQLPPVEIQQEFCDWVRALLKIRQKAEEHLERLNSLFASLQHRAFSGELTARQAERELELAG